jgi:DNA-binding transcriptional LysR family regulator
MLDTNPGYLRTRLRTRQLFLVVALAEEGNIHRAAATLNMTQPAASKMLRELEEMLDVALFERMPRGVRPTLYGDALVRHARAVLGSLDQAQEELIALRAGRLGHVAVGAITSPGVRVLPTAIAAVKSMHANMRITVEINTSNALLEQLSQDKLDVVIGRLSAEHDKLRLRYEPLAGEPVKAVVRRGHPLLDKDEVALPEVQRSAWIVPPAGSILRHRFELMFQRASLAPPSNVVETAALLFITRALEKSEMIAVLTEDVANYYAEHGLVEILPLPMECRMDDFGLITSAEKLLSPAAELMVDALRTASREAYNLAAGEKADLSSPRLDAAV